MHKERQMSREAKFRLKNENKEKYEEWSGVQDELKKLNEKSTYNSDSDSDSDSEDSDSDNVELERDPNEVDDIDEEDNNITYKINDTVNDEDDYKKDESGLSRKAKLFFSNDVFKGIDIGEDDDNEEEEEKEAEKEQPKEETQPEKVKESIEEEEKYDSDDEKENKKSKKSSKKERNSKRKRDEDDDFETVPLETFDSDEEEIDYTLMDPEAYTMAQQIITKKGKRDLIDQSYNRRTRFYTDGLPEWFISDEKEYNKPPIKPVTKEAVKIIQDKMKALNARPIKKVAEARARKRMRAINKLEKIKKKAAVMWDNDANGEMNDKQKLQTIQKMLTKAGTKKTKKEVKLVVAKGPNRGIKGRPKGIKGRYKMVDPRMKKELRAAKRREKETKKRRK